MKTNELKRIIKEYAVLKGLQKLLLADMRKVDPDSIEMSDLRGSMQVLGFELEDLRNKLYEITIGRISPIRLLNNFLIDGDYDDEPKKGGR